MGEDEEGTLVRLKAHRGELIDLKISEHRGRIVKTTGDGFLAEFASVVDALRCAVEIQNGMADRNANVPNSQRLDFRLGLNVGDIMSDAGDIFGDGVNIAARLEALAEPGGICVSNRVEEDARGKLDLVFEDMGEQTLKNIPRAVRAHRVKLNGVQANPRSIEAGRNRPSIAVLPFTNMSGDPEQEYFSDGISEDIITELSRFREFTVIARNSSFRYKGLSPKIQDVGRELDVNYVLEGSVRRIGNRVRVTAQLIDATSAAHIWADRYDGSLDDIFAIQDEITEAVVARSAEGIKGALHARSRRSSYSATAYDLVLQARPYRTAHTAVGSRTAGELLRRAIELDSNFALAHASLAFVRASQFEEGWTDDPDTALTEALATAKRAVALDESDGYAHASLAYVLLKCQEFDQAEHEIEVALALNPNHVNIIMTGAWASVINCNPERAIEMIKRARRLNPFMGGWELWTLGQAYLDAKRYQEALDAFAKVMNPPTDMFLERAICHAYLGQEDDAHRSLSKYLERARDELAAFPGEDSAAWHAFFLRYYTRRRREVIDHFIEGARRAGLHIG
jgi:adenylate cyclase